MGWLILSQDLPPTVTGGVASWVDDAATALAETGAPVTVLARRRGDSRAWDASRPYRVQRVWGRSWARFQGLWLLGPARRRLFPGTRLLCATWPVATRIAPLARARGLSVEVAVHGSEISTLDQAPPALRALDPLVCWRPVSHFLAAELQRLGLGAGGIAVTPMPLPLPKTPSMAHSQRVGLVCVARLTALKGLDAARQLAARLGEPLTVVGAGPEAAGLQARGAGVRWLGALPRAQALDALGRARAALLLSQPDGRGRGAEGLGLVLLEAAARGTPVVGSRVGGIPEAVGTGLVLDDVLAGDLAPLRALLRDPEAGARARDWVSAHHGPAAFVAALGGGAR